MMQAAALYLANPPKPFGGGKSRLQQRKNTAAVGSMARSGHPTAPLFFFARGSIRTMPPPSLCARPAEAGIPPLTHQTI